MIQRSALTSALLVAVVGLTSAARAQVVTFSDGFESGTMQQSDSPPGAWDFFQSSASAPSVTLTVSPAAARSGNFGLRYEDAATGTGSRAEPQVVHGFTQRSGDFHYRFWMRLSGSGGQGFITPAMVQGSVPLATLIELSVAYPGPVLYLQGFDSQGTQLSTDTGVTLTSDVWQQVELVMRGVGGATGERELWLDGQRIGRHTGVDWTGETFDQLLIGGTWVHRAFTGVVDFDDVEGSSTPFPPESLPDAGAPGGNPSDGGTTPGDAPPASPAADVPLPLTLRLGCGCGAHGSGGSFPTLVLAFVALRSLARARRSRPGGEAELHA